MNEISRRDFLRMSALAAAGVAAVACAKTPEPTAPPKEEPTATPKPKEPTATPKPKEPTPTPEPEKPSVQEAPMLSDAAKAGTIPALEERLPKNPLVIRAGVVLSEDELDFEIGKFGGRLRTVRANPNWNPDVFVMNNEPVVWGPGILGENVTGNIFESFEVSGDSKTFTFHMREGLKWSDGEPVTTEDVAFAYEDVLMNEDLSPAFPSWLRSGNVATGEPMKLEVLDEYTFRASFDQLYGGFIVQLAIVGWRGYTDFVKPKHYVKQFHTTYTKLEDLEPLIQQEELAKGEWWALFHQKDHTNWERTNSTSIDFPSVTPWLMVEETPVAITYERNPYYFKLDEEGKQLPYIDTVYDKLVENVESIVMSVLAGEVDFLYEAGAMPSVPVYKENEEKGGYNTVILRSHTEPATVYFNMTFEDDTWRQVVRDVRFRQAMNMSLNRKEIIDSVWLGFGAELPEYIPSEYDPDKAEQLLDEIGLDKRDAEGFRLGPDGKTFVIPFEQPARTPEMTPTCELVVEYLNAVGVKTTMQTIASSLRAERSAANQLKATLERNQQPLWWQRYGGWYSVEWGRLWWTWHTSGGESGEEPPPEVKRFHDLSAQIRVVSPEQRQAVLKEIDKLKYENIFFITPVEKERRPIIASKKMGNVAHDGFSIAACFAGEQLFYKE